MLFNRIVFTIFGSALLFNFPGIAAANAASFELSQNFISCKATSPREEDGLIASFDLMARYNGVAGPASAAVGVAQFVPKLETATALVEYTYLGTRQGYPNKSASPAKLEKMGNSNQIQIRFEVATGIATLTTTISERDATTGTITIPDRNSQAILDNTPVVCYFHPTTNWPKK